MIYSASDLIRQTSRESETTLDIRRKSAEVLDFDVLIVGGGVAGLCAAIASARHGAKTALVQDRPVLGGNSSSEIRISPNGTSGSNSWGMETGLPHEILLEERATNHIRTADGYSNSQYDLVLAECARRESNLRVFFNTTARGIKMADAGSNGHKPRKVEAVLASQMGSGKEFELRARHYIDASGDGAIAYLAGAEFRYGRESRSEFNERLAPVVGDDTTMGSTITIQATDKGRPTPFVPPPWIKKYTSIDQMGAARTFPYHTLKHNRFSGFWWLEICTPYHQIDDYDSIRHELHRHVLGVWNFIKNYSPEKDRFANYALDWVGMLPGKRESRRFMGDVILTEEHLHTDPNWEDAIAYAGWHIDLHCKEGVLNPNEPAERENVDDNYKHWIRVSPFGIPLRSSYCKGFANLWIAGRLMSVTHVALGPVRNQITLGMHGHSVGVAAAYAARKNLESADISDTEKPHLQTYRQSLLKDDVRILGLRNTDPSDVARTGKATASSSMVLDLSQEDREKWEALDRDHAQVVPLTSERLNSFSVYLKNEGDSDVTVASQVQPITRIWDRENQRSLARIEHTIPAGFEGWLTFDFNIEVAPERPYRLIVEKADHVSWARAVNPPLPGTAVQYHYQCSGGCEPKNEKYSSLLPDEVDIPEYNHWWQKRYFSLASKIEPQPQPFEPSYSINGYAAPEKLPNLWIADPQASGPQTLEIEFENEETIDQVQLTLDTNLDVIHTRMDAFWRAAECIADWNLYALVDGEWKLLHEERGNFQRLRRVDFPSVTTKQIRIEAFANNNDGHKQFGARIYEVRAYRADRSEA